MRCGSVVECLLGRRIDPSYACVCVCECVSVCLCVTLDR